MLEILAIAIAMSVFFALNLVFLQTESLTIAEI